MVCFVHQSANLIELSKIGESEKSCNRRLEELSIIGQSEESYNRAYDNRTSPIIVKNLEFNFNAPSIFTLKEGDP